MGRCLLTSRDNPMSFFFNVSQQIIQTETTWEKVCGNLIHSIHCRGCYLYNLNTVVCLTGVTLLLTINNKVVYEAVQLLNIKHSKHFFGLDAGHRPPFGHHYHRCGSVLFVCSI